ncbi:hypothetical protein C7S15_0141 [Burkholderia cepacia]|nr:hypothetical protein [Burkholderia cepacia]
MGVVEFGHAVTIDLARSTVCGCGRGAAPERGGRGGGR